MAEFGISDVEGVKSSVRVVPLVDNDGNFTVEGESRLKSALSKSDGKAAVIVHPFFPEADSSQNNETKNDPDYSLYEENLRKFASRYKSLGLPMLLFEEKSVLAQIPTELERMGIQDGEIFVVPTDEGTARPANAKFPDVVTQLSEIGLKRASVVGSYLKFEEGHKFREDYYPGHPIITQKFYPNSCVGMVIKNFLYGGIRATPGLTTYPPRKKQPVWNRESD